VKVVGALPEEGKGKEGEMIKSDGKKWFWMWIEQRKVK
jgi:hypothetical protein